MLLLIGNDFFGFTGSPRENLFLTCIGSGIFDIFVVCFFVSTLLFLVSSSLILLLIGYVLTLNLIFFVIYVIPPY